MLREDIERELAVIDGLDEKERELITSDIAVAEEAIKDIEQAVKDSGEISQKSKSRLEQFIEDLSDERSLLNKSLKLIRKGKNYGVKITELYNSIADNFGLPKVPPFILDVAKKV